MCYTSISDALPPLRDTGFMCLSEAEREWKKKESEERVEGYIHGVGSVMEKSPPLCRVCGFRERSAPEDRYGM